MAYLVRGGDDLVVHGLLSEDGSAACEAQGLNLETAIDRLLPVLTYCMLEHFGPFVIHQLGEHAT